MGDVNSRGMGGGMGAEDLPLCALSDDRVVEIQGEARLVQRAMELVVSHLRKFLVDRSVLTLFELNVSPLSVLMPPMLVGLCLKLIDPGRLECTLPVKCVVCPIKESVLNNLI
jgi:hypothetical protein